LTVLRSKKGGIVVLGVGIAALGAAGAFAAVQYTERASIDATSPRPGGAVASAKPTIVVTTANASRLRSLRVTVDGRDVTGRVRALGSRLVIRSPALADGRHRAEVRFGTGNVFSRSVSRRWSFTVDTKRPALKVTSPARTDLANTHRVRFTGRGEPRARIRVTWNGGLATARVKRNGTWSVRARLPEGRVNAQVLSLDRAGNGSVALRSVLVDTSAPVLRLSKPSTGSRLTTTDEPLFYGNVPNDSPSRLTFGATVNGNAVPPIRGSDASAEDSATSADAQAGSTGGTTSLQLDGHRFALGIGPLPQGRNTVTVWVRDPAGNVDKRTVRVAVDSTDQFGTSAMVRGASGADVVALQERLKKAGLFRGKATGTYGARTAAAVRRYQRAHDLTANGQVTTGTLRKMLGRIVIDLSAYRLSLIRDGKVAFTFPVAVGQSAYPTPTGRWAIVQMSKNPTWIPPDSPWAKGLGPIPPGPGNPLGTRWIGTSAPAVGIHGTPADYTIGTAASHGCIRMHIPDVEKLYDQVAVGMEVDIQR
jgi:lipoprotein-anchoring transpeptidase ErfK/SrfK